MPKKQTVLTDEERAKRIREIVRDTEANTTAEDFEKAFRKVASQPGAAVSKRSRP